MDKEHYQDHFKFSVRLKLESKTHFVSLSQRDVKSDPEAVRQVARATNNLLESLGSLAVEVRNT